MKKYLARAVAGVTTLLGLGTVTSTPAAADCIDTLAKEARAVAADQIAFYDQRKRVSDSLTQGLVTGACRSTGLTNIDKIAYCANVMRDAHEKHGSADMLQWDRLRAKIREFKNHGVCDGTHLAESLPKYTPVPAGTYMPKMEQHFKAMTSACSADLDDRSNAIKCMGATTQAALSLANEVSYKLANTKQRNSNPTEQQVIQTGIDSIGRNCNPLTTLKGNFDNILQPTLKQISACVTEINFVGEGQQKDGRRRDIVGIAHGDVSGVADNTKFFYNGMKEIAGEALKLNYRGPHAPGSPR